MARVLGLQTLRVRAKGIAHPTPVVAGLPNVGRNCNSTRDDGLTLAGERLPFRTANIRNCPAQIWAIPVTHVGDGIYPAALPRHLTTSFRSSQASLLS